MEGPVNYDTAYRYSTRLGAKFGLLMAALTLIFACSGERAHQSNSGGASNTGGAGADAATVADAGPPHVCATAALDPTVTTSFYEAAQCLFAGDDAPQKGVAAATIDAERVAITRGKVTDDAGSPLPDVRVTVHRHPEFGETLTDAQGQYALAVNGGEGLTLQFEKTGLLTVQRQRRVDWQRFVVYPDVTLLPEASVATAVDLGSATAPVWAGGTEVKDDSGARTQAVLIRPGTKVTLDLPNGTQQELTQFHLRSTEYTVGTRGPGAMPGDLPNTSGYTYAAEFSLDEARSVGATRVSFEPPVISYVDNFLQFPAGTTVPAGYYDSDRATWVPGDSGIVLSVIAVSAGTASIDVTGDGIAEDQAMLTSLGIDAAELGLLGAKYKVGVSVWRVPLAHFSPWDFNWGFGPPPDAEIPNPDIAGGDTDDCQTSAAGSIIGCESQTLGEALAIPGTPISLHYQSERMPGRRDSHALSIQLSGATLPSSVKSILLEVEVLGKLTQRSYAPQANLSDEFDWDGTDAWGRTWQGRQLANVSVGYVYDGSYENTGRFGSPPSGATITGSRTRQEVTLWRKWEGYVGSLNAGVMGLGGWTIDVQHLYDPRSRVLYFGYGQKRSADSIGSTVTTIVGTGTQGYSGDNGPALQAEINQPHGIVVAPDGTVYLADDEDNVIRRVTPDGIIKTIAGTGTAGFSGDGGPASLAMFTAPMGLALGPDGTLYIADADNHRVRAISPDGNIRTIAGGGTKPPTASDVVAANEAEMTRPHSLALVSDGTLYVADDEDNCIYAISPDGKVSVVAGKGTATSEGAVATESEIESPVGIAVSPSGELYYTEWYGNRVRRVDTAGRVWTLAGTGSSGFSGDRGPATLAKLYQPHTVELGPDGSVYITDEGNRRIRRVGPDGYIDTIAGNGSYSTSTTLGDNGPPLAAAFSQPRIVYRHKDSSLWVADYSDGRIRRLRPSLPGYSSGETVLASSDAAELYVFDSEGRHLRTLDAVTKVVLWKFTYDASHRLTTLTDSDGNQTTIGYDTNGGATSITGPYGAQTSLSVLTSGYLGTVTDPLSRKVSFTYTDGGLLETLTEPDNGQAGVHRFTYDTLGRLLKDESPGGFAQTLSRKTTATGTEVALTTPLGRTRIHRLEPGSNGQLKRTLVQPDGAQIVTAIAPGKNTVTTPTISVAQNLIGDPRFGLQAPVVSAVELKSGTLPTLSVTRTRVVTQTDSTDPTSLTHLSDNVGINGRVTAADYDVTARTVTVVSPLGRKAISTWDSAGRIVSSQAGGLASWGFSYDERGRVTKVTVGDRVAQFAYGTNGYLASVTNTLGQTTTFTTDAVGRRTGALLPDLASLSLSYDTHDNNQSITNAANGVHQFAFAPGDLLASYTTPVATSTSLTTTFGYDADQQLTSVTLPDATSLQLSHDSIKGRLVATSLPSSEGQIALSYDETSGKLKSETFAGQTVTLSYNGELVSAIEYAGPVSGGIAFNYNENHWLTSEQVDTASATAFSYDDDGLLTKAGSETLTRHAEHGAVTGTSLGSTNESFTYSNYGELATYSASNGSTALLSYSMTRDALGRIAELTDTVGGESHVYQFTYHPRGWLLEVKRDGSTSELYTYDASGNRISSTSAGTTIAASYDAIDRITTSGGSNYAYSASGQLASRQAAAGTTSYRYNALGALTSVTLPSGTKIDYQLDAASRRLSNSVNGAVARSFIYRDAQRPAAELDASGKVTSVFVYGTHPLAPDYLIQGSRTYKILTDWRGSVRLVVDASTGEIAQRIDYDSFGQVTADSNPGLQPFGFAGGLYDPDTKLVRFGARDYDPEIGRWTNQDPILFGGGQANLYAYAGNDPVNYVDPEGQWAILVAAAGGAATGAAVDLGVQLMGGASFDCIDWGEVGQAAAVGAVLGGVGRFAQLGKEISLGKNLRVAPFGNRTGHPLGRWPHYHRRGLGPSGGTRPGQGIGRHRPWETKSTDTVIWDRF
jgi:RHS repeat-associated protein